MNEIKVSGIREALMMISILFFEKVMLSPYVLLYSVVFTSQVGGSTWESEDSHCASQL